MSGVPSVGNVGVHDSLLWVELDLVNFFLEDSVKFFEIIWGMAVLESRIINNNQNNQLLIIQPANPE